MRNKVIAASVGAVSVPTLFLAALSVFDVTIPTSPGLIASLFSSTLVLSSFGGMFGYHLLDDYRPSNRATALNLPKAPPPRPHDYSKTHTHGKHLKPRLTPELTPALIAPMLFSGGPRDLGVRSKQATLQKTKATTYHQPRRRKDI